MKRGADAMDRGKERSSSSSGNRGDRRSDQDRKRPRHADGGRSRYGPVTGAAQVDAVAVSSANKGVAPAGANGSATVRLLADEKETDPHRLAQRQKQIDYGKNTLGYDQYCAQVPRYAQSGVWLGNGWGKRLSHEVWKHPMTPDKTARIGKKVFDGRVRQWRQALHTYDPPELVQANETPASTVVAAGRASATSSKQEASSSEQGKASSGSGAPASITAPTGQTMKPDSAPAPEVAPDSAAASAETPPTRSIYENFEEGEFDQEDSDDDDLL
ncbi:hypothetical protein BBJ28_00013989 [Nothophytophthora sp. Chile5]|nr:hypothetical protein BBJ28_00013989 [Nothophytophthora sp. Chile5]